MATEGEERDTHRRNFYMALGLCVSQFQLVEDHLDAVLASALGGEADRAVSVAKVLRGRDVKLKAISAVMAVRSNPALEDEWAALRTRFQTAAAVRDAIAHGKATSTSEAVVSINEEVVEVTSSSDWMEVRKVSKKGLETGRTVEQMWKDLESFRALFSDLVAFGKRL